MNAKRAKTLRRQARAETIGFPAVAYGRNTRGSIYLRPCTRAVYKYLKKAGMSRTAGEARTAS